MENKADPYCKVCVKRMIEEGNPHRCRQCRKWLAESSFESWMVERNKAPDFVCEDCRNKEAQRTCFYCGKTKPEKMFPAGRWKQVLKKRLCIECDKQKKCSFCQRTGDHKYFAVQEWIKSGSQRRCKDCVPHRCRQCKKSKRSEAYSTEEWKLGDGQGLCMECNKRRCMKCDKEKGYGAFSTAMWCLPPGSKDFLCKFCTKSGSKIGHWTCFAADCKKLLPSSDFVLAKKKYTEQQLKKARNHICDVCMVARQKLEDDIAASNTSQVLKYRRRS